MLKSIINPDVLDRAAELRRQFDQAKPFRHVIIDDFLRPEIAEEMLRDFPSHPDPSKLLNEFGDPNPKSAIFEVRSLADIYVRMDDTIQSKPFLQFMSRVTGIKKLRYDPLYYGGGTHENFHGAGLDAHYDFNILPGTGQHRRLNAIVYLSRDWDPAWGGTLRFHSDPWDLTGDVVTPVDIVFNRCVIFETNERSWHSVDMLNLPADLRHISRKSFAIYLYTDERPAEELAPEHGTVYVQGGLSPRIAVGRTLDQADMDEIQANLVRRQNYLRQMYRREYQFSTEMAELKRYVRRLELERMEREWVQRDALEQAALAREQLDGHRRDRNRRERDPLAELSIASQAVRAELAGQPPAIRKRRFGPLARRPQTILYDRDWVAAQLPGMKVPSLEEFFRDPKYHAIDPHPLFAAQYYLNRQPDVAAAGMSPLKHYLLHGWREGRDPHPNFANDWYLYRNPAVLAARQVPLEHYVSTGWREGRWPHPLFDPQAYLLNHPEVKAAGIDPLTHFVTTAKVSSGDGPALEDDAQKATKPSKRAPARSKAPARKRTKTPARREAVAEGAGG